MGCAADDAHPPPSVPDTDKGAAALSPGISVSSHLGSTGGAVHLSEEDRLRFARHVLLFLFVICLVVFSGYFFQPQNRAAAAIFELIKIGVPPLVTLVIGFYFPNSSR